MITPISVSLAIFLVTYALLFADKIHRTIISLAGASAMVLAGQALGFYRDFPSKGEGLPSALTAIDFNTIGLLFGMMLLVGMLEETGFFEYISIRLAQLTRGNYWLLMLSLGWFTFIASGLVDNVTTIIFVSSITVSIASVLRVDPIPLLLAEVMMAGIGGMATLIGDPPNIMIGSAAGLSFIDFIIFLTPLAILAGLVTTLTYRFSFRHQIARERPDLRGLMELDAPGALHDRVTMRKILIVLGLVLIGFTLHGQTHFAPATVAMTGASVGLLWVRPNVLEVLNSTKWDVLLFFAGLFVIVGGLEAAGVLTMVAKAIGQVALNYPLLALIAIVWGGAMLSAIVDNIPFTIAFIPVIGGLASLGVDVLPLWWGLAVGVAIGGNATPIGASANVYVISLSDHIGTPIGFQRWLKIGIPLAVMQLFFATLILYGMMKLGMI